MWKANLVVLAALFAVAATAGRMVGAPVDVDVNDERVQNALSFAVVQHNRGTNDMYLRGVDEVLRVQKQVVAGMKYIITVRMGKTPCRKDSAAEVCTVHENPQKAQPYQCTFTVVEKPWLSEIKLLHEDCGQYGGESQV